MSIYKKLNEVRSKIGKLTKDTSNPFFKSKYADINQLIEMTDPILREHGLLCLQPIIDNHLITQIIDIESGDKVESSLPIIQVNDPQKIGSCVTYYRRYTLKSLLNLQEDDDDANKASGTTSGRSQKDETDGLPWLNEKQFNILLARVNKGEKLLSDAEKTFRMKKAYKETLASAEKNYKPVK